MEEVKSYFANFDFDISLLNSKYSKDINPNSKYNKNLQYLFFWTAEEDEQLYVVDKSLHTRYQSKVMAYQSFIPGVTRNNDHLYYWWGDSSTEEKWSYEKEVNSKFTSHVIEKELGFSIISRIGYQSSDLPENLKEYILKKDHGFSGQGVVKSAVDIKYPILIEEKLNRKVDYGTIINSKGCHTFRNLVDQHGQYVGTYLDKCKDNYKDNYKALEDDLYKIFLKYKEKYDVVNLQIDSFSYYKDEKLFLRPLCEVNHRKSMGWITNKLNIKFGSKFSFFVIIPKHKFSNVLTDFSNYDVTCKEGMIQLSLPNESLQSFFITSETTVNLKKYLMNISQELKEHLELDAFISSI